MPRLTRSGCLSLGIGLFIMCSLVSFVGQNLYTRFAGITTTGMVSDTYRVRGSTYARVAFTANSGEHYEFSMPFSFRQYEEGQPVAVAYLESSPEDAIIIRPIWDDLPLLIVLPVIMLISFWCIRHGWKSRHTENKSESVL